jgi:hypothetical protein
MMRIQGDPITSARPLHGRDPACSTRAGVHP